MAERNQPCPCGSGNKYKACCAVSRRASRTWVPVTIVTVFLAIAGWALVVQLQRSAPDGMVWSAEHGHWHDADGGEPGQVRPDGPAPPGKEWSAEHGHWHDIDLSQPPAPAPPDVEPVAEPSFAEPPVSEPLTSDPG